MELRGFSMLSLERKLSLLPWIAVLLLWLLVAAVQLLLLALDPTPERVEVTLLLIPFAFVLIVPCMGGFMVLLLRLRRRGTDLRLLQELRDRLGGEVHDGTFLRPMVRPRLLTPGGLTPIASSSPGASCRSR